MHGRFDTDRLEVGPWNNTLTRSELEELTDILDEETTAFLPESLHFKEGETDVSEWAETFSSGPNQVSSVRSDSKLAGLLMLRPTDAKEGNVMHLGYIFGKKHWGKGLATELLQGLVQKLTLDGYNGEVHAGVVKGNPASAKVLKKADFESMEKPGEPDVEWYRRSFTTGSK